MEMTKAILRQICKDNKLYCTPSINDKLYLHYKGFRAIQNLEEYTALRALWLEGNGLTKIEGLTCQKELRCLFLHENLIETLEGLDSQTELDSLNLSKNYIKKIENLSHMKKLTTLIMSHNQLVSSDDICHVKDIPSLQTLDIQHNRINDPAIVDIVASLPDLRVLYLQGNPVVKAIKNYRKTLISRCPALKYLDDRPVFDEERRRVNAWAAAFEIGGMEAANEAERQEILLIRKEKDDADERNFRAFEQLMKEGLEIRRRREQGESLCNSENSDLNSLSIPPPALVNPFSGEPILDVPESEDLKKFRETRWKDNTTSNCDATDAVPQLKDLSMEENQSKKPTSKFMSLLTSASQEVSQETASIAIGNSSGKIRNDTAASSGGVVQDIFPSEEILTGEEVQASIKEESNDVVEDESTIAIIESSHVSISTSEEPTNSVDSDKSGENEDVIESIEIEAITIQVSSPIADFNELD